MASVEFRRERQSSPNRESQPMPDKPIENYRSKGAICEQLQFDVQTIDVVLQACKIAPSFYQNGRPFYDNQAVDAIRRKLVETHE